MDNFPIEPQQILFIIVFLISALSSLFKKGKKLEEPAPDFSPPPSRKTSPKEDPLSEFKKMIEEARKEASASSSRPTPPPLPEAAPPRKQNSSSAARTKTHSTPSKSVTTSGSQPPKAQPLKPASASPVKAQQHLIKRRSKKQRALTSLLRSPESARQAIILTEVLGKPKGA